MSKRQPSKPSKSTASTIDYRSPSTRDAANPPAEIEFKPPLKPHPKLFLALLILFTLWIGVLLFLYFKTVYPSRHTPASTPTSSTFSPA